MSMTYRYTCAVSLAALVVAAEAPAQSPPTVGECQAAITTLTTGVTTQLDSQSLARAIIPGCGAQGRAAVAQAMMRYRSVTDENTVSMMFRPDVADSVILRAALDLGSDNSASLSARVASFGMLLRFVTPTANALLRELRTVRDGEQCLIGPDFERPGLDTTVIPPNADASIRTVSIDVERNSAQPTEVRAAANCVANAWRVKHQYPPQPLTSIPAGAVRLEYWCGTRFRILNSLPVVLTLQYGQADGPRSEIRAQPRTASGQDGITLFDALTSGTISLFLDGAALASATSTGIACQ